MVKGTHQSGTFTITFTYMTDAFIQNLLQMRGITKPLLNVSPYLSLFLTLTQWFPVTSCPVLFE